MFLEHTFEELFEKPAEGGVDPMECVACETAIQAGMLTGEMGEIVLVDVMPLTLGVERRAALRPRSSRATRRFG